MISKGDVRISRFKLPYISSFSYLKFKSLALFYFRWDQEPRDVDILIYIHYLFFISLQITIFNIIVVV